MVGDSPMMQQVYDAIARVAPLDVTVLITGESGTGKELVARAIHANSSRAEAPYQAVNCAAIPDTLLESDLFGHERGAFTGADRRRIGKFEEAHGGTLFLDEIGDMSASAQAKVLRLLQDQQFQRLGGNEAIQTDVRILAATNQNLDDPDASVLRPELYYRLNVFRIRLPPLRERMEDVRPLAEHFVQQFSRRLGKRIHGISSKAMQCLEAYHWPGNVRELQGVVQHAIVMAGGRVLTPACLPSHFPGADRTAATPEWKPDDAKHLDVAESVRTLLQNGEPVYPRVLQAVERVVLEEVLIHVRGNQVRASELLGISRTTLRTKIRAMGLTVKKRVLSEAPKPR